MKKTLGEMIEGLKQSGRNLGIASGDFGIIVYGHSGGREIAFTLGFESALEFGEALITVANQQLAKKGS
jgi:hypothetical protein